MLYSNILHLLYISMLLYSIYMRSIKTAYKKCSIYMTYGVDIWYRYIYYIIIYNMVWVIIFIIWSTRN